MSVRVWKHLDNDSLLIQFDDDTRYSLPDGLTDLIELEPDEQIVDDSWIELVPEETTTTTEGAA